jgi:hypothetical protein
LSESAESKQTEKRVTRPAFVPRTTGIFVLLIIILSFIAGIVRRELVLSLVGAVFLSVWTYCLLMTVFLALIHCRRARRISIRISPKEIAAGDRLHLVYGEGGAADRSGSPLSGDGSADVFRPFFRLPGILIRCRLLLDTTDGRRVRYDFDPPGNRRRAGFSAGPEQAETLEIPWRGAYFSDYDEFAVFDALGFFRFAFRLPCGNGVRLLASPRAAEEPLPVKARAGESKPRPELAFQHSDNLVDHRPYVPGDDPRRINWKLYGHGGELFVREGEREPPPHSNILIVIDTQFDPLLYSAEMARNGIDLLCENALAAALICAESAQDVRIAWTRQSGDTGTAQRGNSPAELAAALAWPAAINWSGAAELPAMPEDRGILILALPRANAEASALDRFLREQTGQRAGRYTGRTIELVFLYGEKITGGNAAHLRGLAAAAGTCAALYKHRPGLRAWAMEA